MLSVSQDGLLLLIGFVVSAWGALASIKFFGCMDVCSGIHSFIIICESMLSASQDGL